MTLLLSAGAGASADSVSVLLKVDNNWLDIVVEDPPSTLKNLDLFCFLSGGVFPLLFSVSFASCADLLSREELAVDCWPITSPYDVLFDGVVFLLLFAYADNTLLPFSKECPLATICDEGLNPVPVPVPPSIALTGSFMSIVV